MPIIIGLDEFQRRSLFCKKCTYAFKKRCGVIREFIKQQPYLRCSICRKIWSEELIRSGKAEDILFIPDETYQPKETVSGQ